MKQTGNIALGLIVVIIAYLAVDKMTNSAHKVGIVQMEKLVYEYQGMKDATNDYQKKVTKWEAQTDSLEQKLKGIYQEIQLDSINGDQQKMLTDQQRFYYLQKSYYEFKQNVTEKGQQEDQEMTLGVLNQLKEYMKEYATQNGYDLIINNTQMQNVGYTAGGNDITQELLDFSNKKYSGE